MRLGYIDESYDDAECWLTAVLVSDSDHAALSEALRGIRDTAVAAHGLAPSAELHGYDVFHGEHDWAPLKPVPRLRIKVYERVLEAIAEFDCKVIHAGAVRAATEARWPEYHPTEHAHRVAFFGLMTEVAVYCTRENERALLIADEVSIRSASNLRSDVRWLQERQRPHTETNRVIDTVHFIGSHESLLVQAADLVGFMLRRVRAGGSPRAAHVNARLGALIEPLVVARRRWPDQPFA